MTDLSQTEREALERIETRVKAATDGPWSHCKECQCNHVMAPEVPICEVTKGKWGDDFPTIKLEGGSIERRAVAVMDQVTYGEISGEAFLANRDFIAHSREDVPFLLALVRRLSGKEKA